MSNMGPAVKAHLIWIKFVLASLEGTALLGAAQLQPALTTAHDIAAHVTPRDADPPAVLLEATVTFQDPGLTIFLRDDSGVTFVRAAKENPKVAPGDRLRIEGVTHNGLIIGGIKATRIERIGAGPPPEAREITPDELASGKFHYHWIRIGGVGGTLQPAGENTASLRLHEAGRSVEVRFDEAPPDARIYLDAELEVRGLAAGDINDRRQMVQAYVRARGIEDVTIVKPAPDDPFSSPALPLNELPRTGANAHRLMLRGVALGAATAGGLFVRDGDRSVFVQTAGTGVAPGDVVEALGFLEMGVFSAYLSDAEFRVVGTQPVPQPLAVTAKELANGCDADLIEVTARVLQRNDRDGHTEMLTRAGSVNLSVFIPEILGAEAQAESEVKLTGLCRVSATRGDGYRAKPTAYNVWLRSRGDFALVRGAPWWTAQRLALVLGAVCGLALLSFLWVALLRRQVTKQLAQIHRQAQSEAVSEERRRIAREFHDTLEQELAGLSLRLDAAAARVSDEKARELLGEQRRLLMRLQTETRDFVWDLRDSARGEISLQNALASLLEHLQANTAVPLRLHCDGPIPPLPPLVQHHLLRITREAVQNAIRHGRAGGVDVQLRAADGRIALEVKDDGCGFDPEQADALSGHFGIRGMNERARKMGAELQIETGPDRGTRVALTLGVPEAKV